MTKIIPFHVLWSILPVIEAYQLRRQQRESTLPANEEQILRGQVARRRHKANQALF